MKLNILYFLSFLTIAITVNGQLLRGGDDTTVQEQEQEPVATLDLDDDDTRLEFFDEVDGIVIMGTTRTSNEEDQENLDRLSTALNGLSPIELFEKLSGIVAPADLVNAQKRIEKLAGAPSSTNPELDQVQDEYVYNECVDMLSSTGNLHYEKNTNKIGGRVDPRRGCVNIKTEKWNGRWHSGKVARNICVVCRICRVVGNNT